MKIFEERATEFRPKSSGDFQKSRASESEPRALPDTLKLNKSMSNMMAQFTKKPATSRVMLYKPAADLNQDHENSFAASPLPSERRARIRNMLTNLSLNSATNAKASTDLLNHPALKVMSRLVAGHNYDVLENHANKFKKPDEKFQPRILNNNTFKSKLLESSNYYQPPIRRKKKQEASDETSARQQPDSERDAAEKNIANLKNPNESQEIEEDIPASLNDSMKSEFKYFIFRTKFWLGLTKLVVYSPHD